MTLTRAKFNELTAHLVEKTAGPVRQAMSDAGISASDLTKRAEVEKLELSRRYWAALGVHDWKIVIAGK